MAVIFVFSGLALALCERPVRAWRRMLIVEPFVALLVSFSAMWLMRYVDPGSAGCSTLSSGLMAITFYVQSFFVLRELPASGGRMRRRDFLGALGGGAGGAAAPRWLAAQRSRGGDVFVERWSWAMGQPVHLQLFAVSEAEGYETAQAVLGELRRVEPRSRGSTRPATWWNSTAARAGARWPLGPT